uniref:Uncharacterized protein n=1 Tax=Meloidogyne enterolobii TaxID=390850 RepID=A0A6V7WYX9_MELEN|nr:unnamed protein product [Meloidogyne enterolobii]
MCSSSPMAFGILFLYSSLIVIIIGCGLPPAPAPPPPAPCCAPPAPPPPPPCCPCPPPAPMQSCCPCAAAPPPSSHCGGCMFGARRRMYSSASLRKYWRSKREIDVMKVNEATAQKLQYINVTEVPCPRAEWYSPIRKAMISGNPSASVQSIQAKLLHEHDNKFLVMCARHEQFGGESVVIPSALQINSSGVDFCNVKEQSIWCQAIGIIS